MNTKINSNRVTLCQLICRSKLVKQYDVRAEKKKSTICSNFDSRTTNDNSTETREKKNPTEIRIRQQN